MIIRVNLHPARKPKAKENPGIKFLVIGIILALITGVVFYFICDKLDQETKKNKLAKTETQKQIDEITSKISDVATIQSTINSLSERRLVLAQLTSTRQGPQFVLNELARLLSNPHDVLARKYANENNWTLAWDPDNVFIKSVRDLDSGEVEIGGYARTMEDVHEFWNRMRTSPLFDDIRLDKIRDGFKILDKETNQEFVFLAYANFYYRTKDGLALIDELIKNSEETDESDNTANADNGDDQGKE